jgi:anti-sigma regulatory factor (Ser/Thr protein kinase)
VRFEAQVPANAKASSTTREILDGWLSAAVGEGTADIVRHAASELATNAVRHGHLPLDSPMRLLMDIDDRNVHVEVEQASTTLGARVVPPEDRGDDGGFGLAIVSDLTARWGVEAGPPGRVWFDVGIPGASLSGRSRTVAG